MGGGGNLWEEGKSCGRRGKVEGRRGKSCRKEVEKLKEGGRKVVGRREKS